MSRDTSELSDRPAILGPMNRIPWSTAVVVIAVLAALTILVALGKDPATFMSVGTLVLGAVIFGEVRAVREQTNGNTSKMLDMVANTTVQNGQSTGGDTVQSGQKDGNAESVGTQGNP